MGTAPSAYILAGGRSRRFGSDKARAELDGRPLILRVADVLRAVCGEVVVVADRPGKYDDLGLPTIADRRTGLGPVAGLETVLTDRLARYGPGGAILASCDLAMLKVEWLSALSARLGQSGADAAVFRSAFWEPFPGGYHTNLLPAVASLLDEGPISFQRLLSASSVDSVAIPQPADWPRISQVNTPADLASLRETDGGART